MIEANIDHDDGWFLGEDKRLIFTIFAADGVTPEDITGWTLSYSLKQRLDQADSASVLIKTTSDGITLTTPLTGICSVDIDEDDTNDLAPRRYFHELKRTNNGNETVLTHGYAVLRQGVHHA